MMLLSTLRYTWGMPLYPEHYDVRQPTGLEGAG